MKQLNSAVLKLFYNKELPCWLFKHKKMHNRGIKMRRPVISSQSRLKSSANLTDAIKLEVQINVLSLPGTIFL